MALVGYARVSTDDQTNEPQLDALRNAGCVEIFQEHASGISKTRPQLERALKRIGSKDTLVVVRIDRLARSLSHLLSVIEQVTARGAYFKSLGDPIDTASPQGRFSLQVLGAVAELERALIRERTIAGLKAARARGRVGGNPALRRRDPQVLRMLSASKEEAYLRSLVEGADQWLPTVQRLRPERSWKAVARALNAVQSEHRWTEAKLRRAVRRLSNEGLADKSLLDPKSSRSPDDRLMKLVAGIARANPALTLAQIAVQLEQMRESAPRGGRRWSVSTIHGMLRKAERLNLL